MNAYRHVTGKVACVAALVVAFAIASAPQAQAAAMLRLTSGASVTITDNGVGDLNPLVGVITWSGALGVFNVNVTTGLSKPQAAPEIMHLNSVDHSTAAGALNIEFTDDTFLVPYSGIKMGLGASAGGTMTYNAYFDTTNTSFGQPLAGLIGTISGGPGAFFGNASGPGPGVTPYSLTQVVTITHVAAATSSFDATLVPEPASMALFGIGLVGAAFASRKRRSAQKNG